MHDPQTLAFDIKYPWYQYRPWPKKFRHTESPDFTWKHRMNDADRQGRSSMWPNGYRLSLVNIWHVDPEKDGIGDYCGWAWPKLTPEQRERLRNAAWHEGHNPHFLCCEGKEWDGTYSEAESLYRGLIVLVLQVLRIRMAWPEVCRMASEASHILDCGKTGGLFCFLPGYHTNGKEVREDDRRDHFYGILCNVARHILDRKRRWWQHPRWHFWHWKFQCLPVQNFKRWAFSRCSKCGSRFTWGYSPVTNSWHGTGPCWFRSERDVFHSDCNKPADRRIAGKAETN